MKMRPLGEVGAGRKLSLSRLSWIHGRMEPCGLNMGAVAEARIGAPL